MPLAKLVTLDPERDVSEVMSTDLDALAVDMPAAQVAKRFQDLDLISAPVVDADGLLPGRITIDDVVDVIRDEAEHSIMRLAGLDEKEDVFAPIARSARRRAVWLGANLATAFLASQVVGYSRIRCPRSWPWPCSCRSWPAWAASAARRH